MEKEEEIKPETITATETLRRRHGPWTQEERAILDERSRLFHRAVIAPFIDPVIKEVARILVAHKEKVEK